ncbi:MAG: tetratricopeptide repeat protein [Betaproteobacteria bacterium]|nr:tetratricopeptide repeat protein [Betaproteobacteria bacterium]
MAAYDLEEQEQLANLKAWWNQYGNLVLTVVIAASLIVIALRGWDWYQRNQAAQASAVYQTLEAAAHGNDVAATKNSVGELIEKFGGTSYAQLGALTAAKLFYDTGDLKSAHAQLSWAVEHGADELRDLARLRLAAVLLDEKAYDEALKTLSAPHGAGFEARYAEMRGDVLAVQDKNGEAVAAYQAALDALDAQDKAEKESGKQAGINDARQSIGQKINEDFRESLHQKLDALGERK